jgi:hypothetical protein
MESDSEHIDEESAAESRSDEESVDASSDPQRHREAKLRANVQRSIYPHQFESYSKRWTSSSEDHSIKKVQARLLYSNRLQGRWMGCQEST